MNRKSSSSSVPAVEAPLDHRGFEVADRAGRDLPHRRPAAGEPRRVVLGRQVADQRGDAIARLQQRQRLLEQASSCPAPGLETRLTTNTPASRNRSRSARATTSFCLRTFLPDFDETWLVAHASISRATSSSSLPCTISRRRRAALAAAERLHDCEARARRRTSGRTRRPAPPRSPGAIPRAAWPRRPSRTRPAALRARHPRARRSAGAPRTTRRP